MGGSGTFIGRLLGKLERRRALMALTGGVGLLLGLFVSQIQTPRYTAEATIEIAEPINSRRVLDLDPDQVDSERRARNQLELLRSAGVTERARAELDDPDAEVDSTVVEGSDLLRITAHSDDPLLARVTAEAFVGAYLIERDRQIEADLADAERAIERELQKIDQELADLEAADGEAPDPTAGAAPGPAADAEELRQDAVGLRADLRELSVARGLGDPGVQWAGSASASGDDTGWSAPALMAAGALGGLLLGAGIGLVIDKLFPTLQHPRDLERDGLALPVLTTLSDGDNDDYRFLRAALEPGDANGTRVTLFVTPDGDDEAAVVAARYGLACARYGDRVVLVDCDLRRPTLHEQLGAPAEPGLTSVLRGDANLLEAAYRVGSSGEIWVLPAGRPPSNPAEVLATQATHQLIRHVGFGADRVLVVAPPAQTHIDALELRDVVDEVVIVCAAGKTSTQATAETLDRLRRLDITVAGSVFHGPKRKTDFNTGLARLLLGRGTDDSSSVADHHSLPPAPAAPGPSPVERLMTIDLRPVTPEAVIEELTATRSHPDERPAVHHEGVTGHPAREV